MTTGITKPMSALVAALNSLQNAMMFTPCWPNAGPTGGAGLAWPAGICSLICPVTFFAIKILNSGSPRSGLFHLPVFQLHRGVAAENIHRHLELAAVGLDFLDHAAEVQERAVVDLDRLADLEIDLRLLALFRVGDLRLDGLDLVGGRRHGRIAHEPDHTGGVLDEIPG